MRKRVIASVVVVALVAVSVGYYEFTAYESGVVSTTVVTGKIAGFQSSSIPAGSNGATSGATFVTVRIGSNTTFAQLIQCVTFPYFAGMPVQVADQLLQSGQHQYVADIACRGQVSAFKSLHLGSTSTTTT